MLQIPMDSILRLISETERQFMHCKINISWYHILLGRTLENFQEFGQYGQFQKQKERD